jgi:predicted GH43/DUF377 family glycosyl hydrolase
MHWEKRGHIFRPAARHAWMKTHAQVPTALVREDRVRVYFAARPRRELSLTGFVDLDRDDLSRVLAVHPEPVLDVGEAGRFDAHGVMPAAVVEQGDAVYLYYSGWSRERDVPYRNYMGLAVSRDGGRTFARAPENPILGRSPEEPYSATSPWVQVEGRWHMWYSSGTRWLEVDGKPEHVYELKYAWSEDGRRWTRTGKTAVAPGGPEEAITRPTVIALDDGWHMWFCTRGSRDFRGGTGSYRIGHAVSTDLERWERRDGDAGIDVSPKGWDAGMICYPCVFRLGRRVVMLYNGNAFGEDGFGYAELRA